MNRRFILDRKSFEQFLAAACLIQQLSKQAALKRAPGEPNQPLASLLELQRGINTGSVDVNAAMSGVLKLTLSVAGADCAGIWLFRRANEFSCCARIGAIYDPERLGLDILGHLASVQGGESNSFPFSRTLRKASHYPGYPNSVAIAPVHISGKVAGAMAAFSTEFEAFTRRDLENLQLLAGLLEHAIQRAIRSGYREATALEYVGLRQLLENLMPRIDELEKGLRAQPSVHKELEEREPSLPELAAPPLECEVRGRESLPSESAEPADTAGAVSSAVCKDISLPGVGVRAALGDVREYGGDSKPFFVWTAIRACTGRAVQLANGCRSGTQSAVTDAARHLRRWKTGVVDLGREGVSVPLSRFRHRLAELRSSVAELANRTVTIRLVVRSPLPRPLSAYVQFSWAREGAGRSRDFCRALVASCKTMAMRAWFDYGLRGRIRARSLSRSLRHANANLSTLLQRCGVKTRIFLRRQKGILGSSADATGNPLRHVSESITNAARYTAHSTAMVVEILRTRIVQREINKRALRGSSSALVVLAVMAAFLILQAGMRDSFRSEEVNAADKPARRLPDASSHGFVAKAAPQPNPGPKSHLQISDPTVAETLHELTRYEIHTLQRAAESGDDDAAFQLGMAYETGYYVRRSCSQAAHWVKTAAEAGNPAAQYNLGLRYRSGDGLAADAAAAEHWLQMASAQRYSPAKVASAEP